MAFPIAYEELAHDIDGIARRLIACPSSLMTRDFPHEFAEEPRDPFMVVCEDVEFGAVCDLDLAPH